MKRCSWAEVAKRNARIVQMAKDGMRPEQIAEELGMNPVTLVRYLTQWKVKYVNKRSAGVDKRYARKMWEEGDPLPDAHDEKNVAELKEVAKELQSGRKNDNNLW